MRVVAAPPGIERLPADPKMTAGEGRVATMAEIVTHPDQAELASPAQLAPKARELSGFGYLPPLYLHGDTLSSVTNHSEREHSSRTLGVNSRYEKQRNRTSVASERGRRCPFLGDGVGHDGAHRREHGRGKSLQLLPIRPSIHIQDSMTNMEADRREQVSIADL